MELPVSRVVSSSLSPDRTRLLVSDVRGRTVMITTRGDDEDYLEVTADGHGSRVLAVTALAGMPPGAASAASLDEAGSLLAWTAQLAGADTGARVTLAQAVRFGDGERGAALAGHPSLPLVAVATASGVLQLLDMAAAAGPGAEHVPADDFVHFSARVLVPGPRKLLRWSPDGSLLAAADHVTGVVTFLSRTPHILRGGWSRLELLGSYAVPSVSLMQWHVGRQRRLLVHRAEGQLLVLEVPADAARDGTYAAGSLLLSHLRFPAPLSDMLVLPDLVAGCDHASLVGVSVDRSLRRYSVPLAKPPAAAAGPARALPLVPVDAERPLAFPAAGTCIAPARTAPWAYVAAADGLLYRLNLASLEVSQPGLALNGPAALGASAAAVLSDSLLLSADAAGCMQFVPLPPAAPKAGVQRSAGVFDLAACVVADAGALASNASRAVGLDDYVAAQERVLAERGTGEG